MLDYPYDDDATTDFELWLEGEAPRDLAEAVELREAVRTEEDCGRYMAGRDGDLLVVTGSGSEKLIIASDEAKWLFLQIVHQQYIVKFRRRR
jgi:hypothetical protein